MAVDSLKILYVSPMPTSPPRSGAEARMHGLMSNLARRHTVSAVALLNRSEDSELCGRAMREHCREVILVPNSNVNTQRAKRTQQLRSLVSRHSHERLSYTVPALQYALDAILTREQFDVVNLEFPYLAHYRLRQSPPGTSRPVVILDAHDVSYEIVRQVASSNVSFGRRMYASVNWRKLRNDELDAFRSVDGVYACSAADQARIFADLPSLSTEVVPNAADVDYYQPRPADPAPDGRTIVYFGLLSTFPNVDAVTYFLNDIWPTIADACPNARFKVIGANPSPAMLANAGPRVEFTGLVGDLRPHLASAAALVVPLRLGSGTRLKILEGLAMGKAIVSTSLGAEGIQVEHNRHLLIADGADAIAASTIRLLRDPALAADLGRAGRQLAVAQYSWSAAAATLEGFCYRILRQNGAIS
jgi:polysaccharide biosynthesis protein PslH